jgi:hypothetical protein
MLFGPILFKPDSSSHVRHPFYRSWSGSSIQKRRRKKRRKIKEGKKVARKKVEIKRGGKKSYI